MPCCIDRLRFSPLFADSAYTLMLNFFFFKWIGMRVVLTFFIFAKINFDLCFFFFFFFGFFFFFFLCVSKKVCVWF